MTWAGCASYCSSYQYAGISAGSTCRCGNSFTFPQGLSQDALCQTSCTGSSAQSCGGSARAVVFFNSNFGSNSVPASTVPIVVPTTLLPLQSSSVIAVSPLVASFSSASTLAASVSQLPAVSQAAAILPIAAVPQLGGLGSVSSVIVAVAAPLVTPLPSVSLTSSTADVASTTRLTAASTQLPASQPLIAPLSPVLPALVSSVTIPSLAQGLGVSPVSTQSTFGALALPILPSSTVSPILIAPLVAIPPVVSLAANSLTAAQLTTSSLSPLGQSISSTAAAAPLVIPVASPTPVPASIVPLPILGLDTSASLLPVVPLTPIVLPTLPGPSSALVLNIVAPVASPLAPVASPLAPVTSPLASVASPLAPVLLSSPNGLLQNILPSISVAEVIATPIVPLPSLPSVTSLPLQGLPSPALAPPLLQPIPSTFIGEPMTWNAPVQVATSQPSTSSSVAIPFLATPSAASASLIGAVPLLVPTPSAAAPLLPILPTLLPLAIPQVDSIPLVSAPTVLPVLGVQGLNPGSSIPVLNPAVPLSVVTQASGLSSLPAATAIAIPAPLALPALPVAGNGNILATTPTIPILGPLPIASSVSTISTEPTIPQIIESGTVVDKVFTWIFYDDGNAQVDSTLLSPATGPIQAYLVDGTRVGMDSAGLYIGWEHRVPYPPEFLQIIRGYALPPPQLFL